MSRFQNLWYAIVILIGGLFGSAHQLHAQSITFSSDFYPDEVTSVIVTFNGTTILDVSGLDLWPNGETFTDFVFSISSYGSGDYTVFVNDIWGDGGTGVTVDAGPFDCSGDCSGSVSGSGSTFNFTLTSGSGCPDETACNYTVGSLDDGSCLVPADGQDCCPAGLFFSEFSEGAANDTYFELFNASPDTIRLENFLVARTANQLNPAGGFDFEDIVFSQPSQDLAPGGTYIVAEAGASPDILALADTVFPEISSGDDALGLIRILDSLVVDQIGIPGTDEGLGWTVAGTPDATYNRTIIRKPNVSDGNGGDWSSSAGLDTASSEWMVLSGAIIDDAGQHAHDGACIGESPYLIRGCTNPLSCIYHPDANAHVETMCDFTSCYGCMESAACNYDPEAEFQGAGDCAYPEDLYGAAYVDCAGICLNDQDLDGVCDEDEPVGCIQPDACNFDALAEFDDGSCEYETCAGCTDPEACNFDSEATFNVDCDYACVTGCTTVGACNYDPVNIVDDGSCDYACVTGCTDPFACNYGSLNIFDDGSCEFTSCLGCTDPDACNFSASAIYDDGSCSYDDDNGNGICDYLDSLGCLEVQACNFNPVATIDDGSCSYPLEDYLDCDNNCLNDINANDTCDELEIQGCMNPEACNYDSMATLEGPCDGTDWAYIDCDGNCLNDSDGDGICDEEECSLPECGFTANWTDTLLVACDDSCFTLSPGPSPFLATTAYNVNEIEFSPPLPVGTGVLVSTPNNGFTNGIGIPFGFSFFDTDFFSLKINRKGFLTFNTGLTGTYNYPNEPLGSGSLPSNSVMAPYAYISNSGGEIRTATIGEFPNRKFIVSWESMPQTGCADNLLISQVVLFESTNAVEMHIGQFQTCLGITAAVGIQGGGGEGAFGPEAYDTGEFAIFEKAFRFMPSGAAVAPYYFFSENGLEGYGDSLEVCGPVSQSFIARIPVPIISPPPPVVGSCDVLPEDVCDTSFIYNFNLASSETGSIDFAFDGTLLGIAVTNNWIPSGGSWPGDMGLQICDPSGNCGFIQGFNINQDGTNIGDWPFNWNTTEGGFYESCFGVPSGLLAGNGTWTVTIQNGWTGSGGGVNFDGTITLFTSCSSENEGEVGGGLTIAHEIVVALPEGLDLDGNGVCDSTECLTGTLDDCGVCDGPGAVYECGCAEIPDGDCDCDGNQLDAIGICGGACTEDLDADGVCDTEDDCIGELDSCGVCNGPGPVLECGCIELPAGDCDCDGNQLDVLGVCGGGCVADDDENGICDANEVPGCTYPTAVNFNPLAAIDDGSCSFPGCMDTEAVNYSPHYNADGGGCLYPEDFEPDLFCRADFDDSGLVGAADLIIFLGAFEFPCE